MVNKKYRKMKGIEKSDTSLLLMSDISSSHKTFVEKMINTLNKILVKKYAESQKGNIAVQIAASYILSKHNRNFIVPFDKIVEYYKRYQKRKRNNLSVSDYVMSDIVGINLNTVTKLRVYQSGTSKAKNRVPGIIRKSMINGLNTDFSKEDIAYFLNLNLPIVGYLFSRNECNNLYKPGIKEGIRYRKISQIFEAQDCSMSLDETVELVNLKKDKVKMILGKRDEFGPKLISELRNMFPNENITKPYLVGGIAAIINKY